MALTIAVDGLGPLVADLAKADVRAGLASAMPAAAALVEDEMKRRTPHGTFRTVAPSSGALQASETHTPPAWNGAALEAVVGPTLPYGYWINYGRFYGGRPGRRKLGPELFLENAAAAARERVGALFAAAVAGLFRL